jgi:hypothetical protein
MYRIWSFVVIVSFALARVSAAQAAGAPPAAPLLEHLAGNWTMKGTVLGKPATYRLRAAWTLQHRFIELHMRDVAHTPPAYEARVFLGPDTLPGRVVAHWMDNTGAAFSVPPATGKAEGDSLTLDFPYPTGTFHDSFRYDRASNSWTVRLDAADGKGGWRRFAEYHVVQR